MAHTTHTPAADNSLNLQRIVSEMQQPIRLFAHELREVGGGSFIGLVMYGAVVDGPFDRRHHRAHSVVLMDQIRLERLRMLSDKGKQLADAGFAVPLVMTPTYITQSLDAFPIELLDIHQHHVCVFGDNPFAQLTFHDGDIRAACERELKSLLIRMRQGLLAAAGRDDLVGQLEMALGDETLRVIRAILWLKGQHEPKRCNEALADIERVTARKLPGLRAALSTTDPHDWPQYVALYQDLDTLAEMVNGWA